ncbi:MAG TPA: hypothetical protein PKA34_32530, partial [Blastocatellia bacterium]|nr:hypothetical protein [Blastocatellia bacterium]
MSSIFLQEIVVIFGLHVVLLIFPPHGPTPRGGALRRDNHCRSAGLRIISPKSSQAGLFLPSSDYCWLYGYWSADSVRSLSKIIR